MRAVGCCFRVRGASYCIRHEASTRCCISGGQDITVASPLEAAMSYCLNLSFPKALLRTRPQEQHRGPPRCCRCRLWAWSTTWRPRMKNRGGRSRCSVPPFHSLLPQVQTIAQRSVVMPSVVEMSTEFNRRIIEHTESTARCGCRVKAGKHDRRGGRRSIQPSFRDANHLGLRLALAAPQHSAEYNVRSYSCTPV
jgi:hypothetical protein